MRPKIPSYPNLNAPPNSSDRHWLRTNRRFLSRKRKQIRESSQESKGVKLGSRGDLVAKQWYICHRLCSKVAKCCQCAVYRAKRGLRWEFWERDTRPCNAKWELQQIFRLRDSEATSVGYSGEVGLDFCHDTNPPTQVNQKCTRLSGLIVSSLQLKDLVWWPQIAFLRQIRLHFVNFLILIDLMIPLLIWQV